MRRPTSGDERRARLAAARAAPALRRPARSFTVLETMARPVANMPNKIAEYRTPYVQNLHLHGADNPTYLKGDGDKTQVAVGFALLGFALLQVTRGLYNGQCPRGKSKRAARTRTAPPPRVEDDGGRRISPIWRRRPRDTCLF